MNTIIDKIINLLKWAGCGMGAVGLFRLFQFWNILISNPEMTFMCGAESMVLYAGIIAHEPDAHSFLPC